jgi:hypothetical protein
MATDETEKNRGTVRNGDFYEGRMSVIKAVDSCIRQGETDVIQGSQKVFRKAVK